jgi:hypothetical protein
MADRESGIVAGLFATRAQAMTVEKNLRRIGLADQDIEVGTPASGRYRLDVRESEDLGGGALDGIVIGTLVGALVGVLFVVLAVPRAMEMGAGAILLGILLGGLWGSFFGGLAGMVVKASAHGGRAQWCEIPERSNAVLVIARAGGHADAARKVMRRDGARTLLRQASDLVSIDAVSPARLAIPVGPGQSPSAEASPPAEAIGAGWARSEDQDGADRTRSIGIPRGAFLLLVFFLIAVSALWANVYLRVVWRT